MDIANFIEKIKVQSLDDYLQYVINVYAESQTVIDSYDGANLRELFRRDSSSSGDFNQEDYSNFFNKKLVADLMVLKDLYNSYVNEQDRDMKANLYSEVAKEIVDAITPFKGYVVLDSSRLRGTIPQVNLEHEFTLNVNAADVVKVLRSIYSTAVANNIDFFITMPNVVNGIEGTNDFISIICETQKLGDTLRLLELIPSDIKALCKTPCPFGGIIDGWIGYASVEKNHDISSVIGRSIIQGIDNAIKEYATIQPDVAQYVEALNSGINKDQTRIQVLKIMRELNPENYSAIINHIKTMLVNNNINLEYLFISKSILETLGVESTQDVKQNQRLSTEEAAPGIPTPPTEEEPKNLTQDQIMGMLENAMQGTTNGEPNPALLTQEQIEAILMGNNSAQSLGEASVVAVPPIQDGVLPSVNEAAQPLGVDGTSPLTPPTAANVDSIVAQGGEVSTTPLEDPIDSFTQGTSDDVLSGWTNDNVQGVNEINVQDPYVSVPQASEVGEVTAAVAEQAVSEVLVTDANRAVYAKIGLTDDILNTMVTDQNNNQVTLYHFLESNETLRKVPLEATVTLIADVNNVEANQSITGAQFIVKTIVPYATRLGKLSVDGIIEMYASSIKLDENKKKSLFGGLFKKK